MGPVTPGVIALIGPRCPRASCRRPTTGVTLSSVAPEEAQKRAYNGPRSRCGAWVLAGSSARSAVEDHADASGSTTRWRRLSCHPLAIEPSKGLRLRLTNLEICSLSWSGRRDSNPRPQPWQGCALPAEPRPRRTHQGSNSRHRDAARGPGVVSGTVTTHTWLRRGGVWFGTVVGFFVALHLIWPMPVGIIAWSIVFSSIIALLAIGIALIYRSHRVINFAMADLGAVPASLAVTLVGLEGWSWWVAVPFALLVAVALGSATEFVVIRRFEKAPRLVLMVATIGLAQVLAGHRQGGARDPEPGADPARPAPRAVLVQLRDLADHPPRRRSHRGRDDGRHVAHAVRVPALHQPRHRARVRARRARTARRCSA